jgi:uncharacterized membrane protein YphA (DoxX/SURF4 family)
MNEPTRSPLLLGGRVLLAAIFLLAGIGKLSDWTTTAQMMSSHGMVAVDVLLQGR